MSLQVCHSAMMLPFCNKSNNTGLWDIQFICYLFIYIDNPVQPIWSSFELGGFVVFVLHVCLLSGAVEYCNFVFLSGSHKVGLTEVIMSFPSWFPFFCFDGRKKNRI